MSRNTNTWDLVRQSCALSITKALSPRAIRLFGAICLLIPRGSDTVVTIQSELSKISKVERSRISETLRTLERLGLITVSKERIHSHTGLSYTVPLLSCALWHVVETTTGQILGEGSHVVETTTREGSDGSHVVETTTGQILGEGSHVVETTTREGSDVGESATRRDENSVRIVSSSEVYIKTKQQNPVLSKISKREPLVDKYMGGVRGGEWHENHAEEKKQTPKRTFAAGEHALLSQLGIPDQLAKDWIQLRKAKRAPVTATVMKAIEREAEKARMSLDAVLELCCQRGWQGFKADWVTGSGSNGNGSRVVEPTPAQKIRLHEIERSQMLMRHYYGDAKEKEVGNELDITGISHRVD